MKVLFDSWQVTFGPICIALFLIVFNCGPSMARTYNSNHHSFQVEVLLQRSDVIWGFDFLPDGKILFTERSGQLLIFDPVKKSVSAVTGVPKVYHEGQGGLLDVRVHPEFSKTKLIFFTYSKPINEEATTALIRAELNARKLVKTKELFSAHEPNDEKIHFGSRIEFDGKGHIFFSVGDRHSRDHVQDLSYHNGKILRINENGSVPKDNPFVQRKGAQPEIWSYGHRNPQGLVLNPVSKEIWSAEYGPRGGDEVNLIRRGRNYGWPVITYGREYWGPSIGEGYVKKGMEQPVVYYVPSISPSGITFYYGDKFPQWKGNLFLANLSGMHLRRLELKGHKVKSQEVLLQGYSRFRHVRQGPDGYLYFSTDDGQIARLIPKP